MSHKQNDHFKETAKEAILTTQDLIFKAAATEPMRATLGSKADWMYFADHNGITVQLAIFGNRFSPEKRRATFWDGSESISRAEAERRLAK